jgi:RNA-binding protein NOB1
MLEREEVGNVEHLRTEPLKAMTQAGSKRPTPPQCQHQRQGDKEASGPRTAVTPVPTEGASEGHGNTSAQAAVDPVGVDDESKESKESKEKAEDDDDEGGWITPKNVAAKKASHRQRHTQGRAGKGLPHPCSRAALLPVVCMTSDFAMQNVLLMMNLKLTAPDEHMRITRLKNWLLRCHACFKTTKDMSKKFCPSCGNATLIRTSVSVDAEGNVTLYLKRNFQYNNRGTIFNIPKPTGGRGSKDLILREDQREYEMALRKQRTKAAAAAHGDVFGLEHLGDGKAARPLGPSIMIGNGRKNVNERRRSRK